MARFYFVPDGLTVVDNTAHTAPFCAEKNDGLIMTYCLKENTGGDVYAPSYGVIDVSDPVKLYGDVKLVDWGRGNYDVVIPVRKFREYSPPVAQAQKSASFSDYEITVTVYTDGSTHAIFECSGGVITLDLPELSNPDILFSECVEGLLCVVRGDTADGEYLAIVLFNGTFKKLFASTAQKFTFSDSAVTAAVDLKDMLGRRKITDYDFRNGNTESRPRFEYLHDKSYPEELTPYLFLEALQARDFTRLRTYLSHDLRDNAEDFTDFFGDFKEISAVKHAPAYKKSDLLKVALIPETELPVTVPKIASFRMEEGLITDVSCD